MENRALFIHERYCDGDPNKGLTNSFHNLCGSFKRTFPNIPFNILNFDACLQENNIHVDKVLPKVVESYRPNVAIVSFLGKEKCNPSIESFKFLKDSGIKTIINWPDVGDQEIMRWIEELKDVDLHVGWDNASSPMHDQWKSPSNFVQMFVPQDPRLYSYHKHKDILISFIGSTRYQERAIYLQHAINSGCPIHVAGGQREQHLSAEQYANLLKRSFISINFAGAGGGGFSQCKGRVNEIMAVGSLLFESKNASTSRLYEPNADYVEFGDPNDLVQKLHYYANNKPEAEKIMKAGHQKFNDRYTADKFWKGIFDRIGYEY